MNTEYWLREARLLEPFDLVDFASSVLQILFSTPREENWVFTVQFYSVQYCSRWNRRFFFAFFRRAEESAKLGWRTSCARLALYAWPALAFAHLKNAKKKKKRQQQQRLFWNGRKLEKTAKSVAGRLGGINYVYLHDVLAPRSYPIFTLESKYGGRSRRRSDNEETVF